MLISVVVSTFNRRAALARTLQCIFAQALSTSQCEIIVVDDGSSDDTWEYLAALESEGRLRAHRHSLHGLAASRNRGLAEAHAPIVIFLDDDLTFENDLLARHLERHRGQPDSETVVIGAVLPAGDARTSASRWTSTWLHSCYQTYSRDPDKLRHFGVNCSAPRKLLAEMGGYDESFVGAHEDIELGFRMRQRGTKFIFAPHAIAHHAFDKSAGRLIKDARLGGAAEVRMCRKHPAYRPASLLAQFRRSNSLASGLREIVLDSPLLSSVLAIVRAGTELLDGGSVRALTYACNANLLQSAAESAGGRDQFRREFWQMLPVLLYHTVTNTKRGQLGSLAVSPQAFEQQLAYLSDSGYKTITPKQWMEWLARGTGLPPKPVLITFDDAYASLTEFALPLLRSAGLTATVFVPTSRVGQSNLWDRRVRLPELRLMTLDQIEYWNSEGMHFGGHSRTHADLTDIGVEEGRFEVQGCAEDLQGWLGPAPVAFAYPYGRHNADCRQVVGQHFRLAVTVEEGLNDLATPPLELRRTMVQPADSMADFALRLRFGYSPLQTLKSRLRNAVGRRPPM